MSSTHITKHPKIGQVHGIEKNGIIQYLGLRYATLSDRFAPAVLNTYGGNETLQATKVGPAVVPIPNGPEIEQGLMQHTVEYDKSTLRSSDTEGLNLNISIPILNGEQRKLPVFVFIHGGGFMVGSATWPQYDFARFARLSKQKGKPVIAIGPNYRLGAPGLLTSPEMRSAGYKTNNIFRDQHCALLWIEKYISGFGGDEENITLAGESAGGVSVSYQMFSKMKLFKRVVCMSGTSLLMAPVPLEFANANGKKVMEVLGLKGKSTEEQVEYLRTTDALNLRTKLMTVPMLPVADPDSDPPLVGHSIEEWRSGKVNIPQHVESMMIGDCQFDGNIQALRIMHRKKGIAKAFCTHIKSSKLPPDVGDKLLAGYGIKSDLDDEEAFLRVLEVANDVGFYVPTNAFAETFAAKGAQKAYVYRFNEPNPWDGPWKGCANHILDIAFLFQNFSEYLDEQQRTAAEQFAEDVFKFCYGEAPWEAWKSDKRVAKVLGPNGKMEVTEDVPGKVGRRSILFDRAEEIGVEVQGMDKICDVFNAFLRGPPAS